MAHEIVLRDVGSNEITDVPNSEQRNFGISAVKFRFGRLFRSGPDAKPEPAPPPAEPPEVELERQQRLLVHLQQQQQQTSAFLDAQPELKSFTAAVDATARMLQYQRLLNEFKDVATQEWADRRLLLEILQRPDTGLIRHTAARIADLERRLAPPATPAAAHARLIAAEIKTFRVWAVARQARRKYEKMVPVAMRSKLESPRPACGMNFLSLSDQELDRAAEMAISLPDHK